GGGGGRGVGATGGEAVVDGKLCDCDRGKRVGSAGSVVRKRVSAAILSGPDDGRGCFGAPGQDGVLGDSAVRGGDHAAVRDIAGVAGDVHRSRNATQDANGRGRSTANRGTPASAGSGGAVARAGGLGFAAVGKRDQAAQRENWIRFGPRDDSDFAIACIGAKGRSEAKSVSANGRSADGNAGDGCGGSDIANADDGYQTDRGFSGIVGRSKP